MAASPSGGEAIHRNSQAAQLTLLVARLDRRQAARANRTLLPPCYGADKPASEFGGTLVVPLSDGKVCFRPQPEAQTSSPMLYQDALHQIIPKFL